MSIFNIQFKERTKNKGYSFEHILPLENVDWASLDVVPDLNELKKDFSLTFKGKLLKFEDSLEK